MGSCIRFLRMRIFLQSHIEKSSAVATDISKTQALGHPHKFRWKNTAFWVSVLGVVRESELDCFKFVLIFRLVWEYARPQINVSWWMLVHLVWVHTLYFL